VGFGRACAPVRCAHPSFWAHCHAQRGAARPPSIAASPLPQIKNKLFPETKCLPSAQTRAAWGIYFSNGLSCTLLSYAAPYLATLHPTKLCCIQMSYAAPYLSFSAPQELRYTLWTKLHPSELCCTLLSYAAPFWAMLHPSELSCTLPELRCTLRATLHPLS